MPSAETKSSILDKETVRRKIKRMALEIAEQNTEENELIIAGIVGNGEIVARSVAAELQTIVPVKVSVVTIQLNKKELRDVSVEGQASFQDKVIIIADDVANTGKTMFFALKPFLASTPKKLQTLVLVERSHKLFPIQTDYAGLTIATTLQEHIAVETKEGEITGAWLF
ncbi:phosphoribosyltransferase family protein [Flavisolibacter nicotianae]|uniref:phosphoribosyltransferase family protein n=1 Tax=Flavisolibacter nicotianae TaxID=2364882 RepID=UPI000EAD1DF8|nr:phosphoribosyltransferase family protein [Flavisolibacter nicotianae]